MVTIYTLVVVPDNNNTIFADIWHSTGGGMLLDYSLAPKFHISTTHCLNMETSIIFKSSKNKKMLKGRSKLIQCV